jgi:hypothetical protein
MVQDVCIQREIERSIGHGDSPVDDWVERQIVCQQVFDVGAVHLDAEPIRYRAAD